MSKEKLFYLLKKKKGAAGTEYGILVGLIAVTLLLVLSQTGSRISQLFSLVSNSLILEDTSNSTTSDAGAIEAPSEPTSTYKSCKELLAAKPETTSGVYQIDPDGDGTAYSPFDVYCLMDVDGGGWTLVMRGYGGNKVPAWLSSKRAAIVAAATPAPDMTETFKLSDATINGLGGTVLRVDIQRYGIVRYAQAGAYCHNVYTSTDCGNASLGTFSDAGLSSDYVWGVNGGYTGIRGGITSDQTTGDSRGSYIMSYENYADSSVYRGWALGNGSTVSASFLGCVGYATGCNFAVYER